MKAGELFVELSIKGADKAVGSVTDLDKALKDTTSDALAAQAKLDKIGSDEMQSRMKAVALLSGTLGTAIGEISKKGSEAGRALDTFHMVTGQDTKPIQELAAGLGTSVEHAIALGTSLQGTMAQIEMHGAASGGLFGLLGIDMSMPHDVKSLMAYAQKAAINPPKGIPIEVMNKAFAEIGITGPELAMMRKGGNLFPSLPKDQYINNKEAGDLTKINVGWEKLAREFETLGEKLALLFGPELINALTSLTETLLSITGWFGKESKEHPDIAQTIGQQSAVAAISTVGSVVGGTVGFLGGLGVGAVPGAAAGGLAAAALAESYFGIKNASALYKNISKDNSNKSTALDKLAFPKNSILGLGNTTHLTVNNTNINDGIKSKKTIQKQFDSKKGGDNNQTHTTRSSNIGS